MDRASNTSDSASHSFAELFTISTSAARIYRIAVFIYLFHITPSSYLFCTVYMLTTKIR